MNAQITIDFRAVAYAAFYWKNQEGITKRCKPRVPTVNGSKFPVDELAPVSWGISSTETLLQRAKRLNLLDIWTPCCELFFRNNHSLKFTGESAKQKFKAYNHHIYGTSNSKNNS